MRTSVKQTAAAAAIFAAVALAGSKPADGSSYGRIDLRQNREIHTLQVKVDYLRGDVSYLYQSAAQLQCEIEHGANNPVCN